jgi:hypothetical protein
MSKLKQEMAWDDYTKDRLDASSKWYYLNQAVKDRADEFANGGGIYIYTDRDRWERNEYKIGETVRGEERIFEQSGAGTSQAGYIIDFIPLAITSHEGYDKTIHKVLKNKFNCEIIKIKDENGDTEWIQFDKDVCPVGTTMLAIQLEKSDKSAGRVELMLTESQVKALDKALECYKTGKVLLAELCPRFGKTPWAMALFDHTDYWVMVVASYVHSVFNSFKTDYLRFTQFEHLAIATSAEEVEHNKDNGLRSLVLVPLTGKFDQWEKNYGWINSLDSKFVFVDEADFGAHRAGQVKKVKYLTENA